MELLNINIMKLHGTINNTLTCYLLHFHVNEDWCYIRKSSYKYYNKILNHVHSTHDWIFHFSQKNLETSIDMHILFTCFHVFCQLFQRNTFFYWSLIRQLNLISYRAFRKNFARLCCVRISIYKTKLWYSNYHSEDGDPKPWWPNKFKN